MAILKEIEITAKTVQDAIEEGKTALGLSDTDDVQFDIIQMDEKKLFRSKPAIVKVYVEGEEPVQKIAKAEQKPEQKMEKKAAEKTDKKPEKCEQKAAKKPEQNESRDAKPQAGVTDDLVKPAEKEAPDYKPVDEKDYSPQVVAALAFLKPVLEQMELSGLNFEVFQAENEAQIAISGDNASFLIGRRGETMSALQYLLSLAVNRKKDGYYRIVLNVENYREKREKTLESLALRIAKSAVRTGRSTTLEPMNPYERRIIHSTVQRVEGATSVSVGEEPNRKVVIKSKTGKPVRSGESFEDRGDRTDREDRGEHAEHTEHGPRNDRRGGRNDRGRGGKGRDGRDGHGRYDKPRESHRIESEKREPKSDLDFGDLYGKIEL